MQNSTICGFKFEAELTQDRLHHLVKVENEERNDNMIRDANDDKAEGRLLKASRSSQITIRSNIVHHWCELSSQRSGLFPFR